MAMALLAALLPLATLAQPDCALGGSCPASSGPSMLQRSHGSLMEHVEEVKDEVLEGRASPSQNHRRRRRESPLAFCWGFNGDTAHQDDCVRTSSEPAYDFLKNGADPKPLIRGSLSNYQKVQGSQVYGLSAEGNSMGKIGGGASYTRKVNGRSGVNTAEELVKAIAAAKDGDTIFITGSKTLQMHTLKTHAIGKRWQAYLKIWPKITLASDRGVEGSAGALLDWSQAPVGDTNYTYGIYASQPIRITGLRMRGNLAHNFEREHDNGRKARSVGVLLRAPSEIDNVEIFSWIHAGIRLDYAKYHLNPMPASFVHHSHIHSTHYFGLGYGIGVTKGKVRVEWTQFQRNRHAIASSGGDYDAWEMGNCAIFKPNIHSMVDMHETTGQYFQLWNTFIESYFYFKDRGNEGGIMYPEQTWAAFNYIPEAKDGSDWVAYRGLDCNMYSSGVWDKCKVSDAAKLIPAPISNPPGP